ncbi:hypothetical protein ElyMa_002780600 [Elysia marginata]|uniref:Fibrinogen C-terminal domain-containing protein n=1 Tax=Elysia marginata TaxID=1093978 RepID=A0AAV4HQE5_9GAST|nr:hypothetical protein ElyMa_002780600 [Elysia marginata]
MHNTVFKRFHPSGIILEDYMIVVHPVYNILCGYFLNYLKAHSEMARGISVIIVLFLLGGCRSLEFTLTREKPDFFNERSRCGVLICKEVADTSVSPKLGQQAGSNVSFKSISKLSVFKSVLSTNGIAESKQEDLIGSITSQSPRLSRVANGRKIEGLLKTRGGKLQVELVKDEDCRAEFSCEVRGKDAHGMETVHSARVLQPKVPERNQIHDGGLVSSNPFLLTSIQQLTQSFTGLEKRMDDKITFLQNRLEDRLSDFENRIEDKIENNNNLNKLIHLDSKVSTKLEQFSAEAKTDILASLDNMMERLYSEQKEILQNVAENVQRTLNDTSSLLSSVGEEFVLLKSYSETNVLTLRNETTEAVRELLTSGEVISRCLANETANQDNQHELPARCQRDMGREDNKTYPRYIVMSQLTLQRHILCDTNTDGGGWTIIQVRVWSQD